MIRKNSLCYGSRPTSKFLDTMMARHLVTRASVHPVRDIQRSSTGIGCANPFNAKLQTKRAHDFPIVQQSPDG